MEKLTIEQLAPYLAYKLHVALKNDWHSDNWDKYEILEMTQLSICDMGWFYIGGHLLNNLSIHKSYEDNQFKPLFYPLSMLTKEIEIDGKKFVPIAEIYLCCNTEADYEWIDHIDEGRNMLANWDNAPHWMVKLLYKWHFAIDIPEHLYIDKSTIKN